MTTPQEIRANRIRLINAVIDNVSIVLEAHIDTAGNDSERLALVRFSESLFKLKVEVV